MIRHSYLETLARNKNTPERRAQLIADVFGPVGDIEHPRQLHLGSTFCRQQHLSLPEFTWWIRKTGEEPTLHRKQWEYFYVGQSLWDEGMLKPGRRGLVFGVGQEPLPSLFASFGCEILATDQAETAAQNQGWVATREHSSSCTRLNERGLCDPALFAHNVRFRAVDMNAIPEDLGEQFDFCWSTCCFEHLGSLEHGMRFVEASLATLRPGGVAVHTTEFNFTSNIFTAESPGLSLYRRRDIERLARRLKERRFDVAPLDFSAAGGLADRLVDLPPYKDNIHLRLRILGYDCTSFGLLIRKPAP